MFIGISGKSGSGKSEIAEMLAKLLGGIVIHFDDISRIVTKSKWYAEFVKNNFGESIICNGVVNTKKLGQIVFSDPTKLKLINQACEPKMYELIDEIIKKNKNKAIIAEYALLPLTKYFEELDVKILLECDILERSKRVTNRDEITEEYFMLRENNSLDFEKLIFDLKFDTTTKNTQNVCGEIIKFLEKNYD